MKQLDYEYFSRRATVRQFTSEVPPKDLIERIVAAAMEAPNTGNMQLYSVVETRDPENLRAMSPMHFNQPTAVGAPVILTVCADVKRFERWCEVSDATPSMRNLQMLLAAITDAVILAQQIVTIAELEGLGTCYLGTVAYNAPEIAELLGLPDGVIPVAALALGYPAATPDKCERLPVNALLHSERYARPDDEEIKTLYSAKDDFEPNRKFVTENGKKSLAQVFTDVRYPAANNLPFSKRLADFLKAQGFDINPE